MSIINRKIQIEHTNKQEKMIVFQGIQPRPETYILQGKYITICKVQTLGR